MNSKLTIPAPLSTAFTIWIDGDACPVPIREIVYRNSKRLLLKVVIVANAPMWIPKSDLLSILVVPHGADVADNRIVESLQPGDIVITGDIPLAARVVDAQATAIGIRGQLYDDSNVHGRLATRNLMEQLRSAGMETAGPRPFDPKDAQAFANQLDRVLTKRLRAKC